MKKAYSKPEAKKFSFDYKEQVAAASPNKEFGCGGGGGGGLLYNGQRSCREWVWFDDYWGCKPYHPF